MHTAEVMRERMFTMRLSKEESDRLDSLAAHYGLNAAGVIRLLLKREADQVERDKAFPYPGVAERIENAKRAFERNEPAILVPPAKVSRPKPRGKR